MFAAEGDHAGDPRPHLGRVVAAHGRKHVPERQQIRALALEIGARDVELAGEMPVESLPRNARRLRDIVDRGGKVTRSAEQFLGGGEEPLAILLPPRHSRDQ